MTRRNKALKVLTTSAFLASSLWLGSAYAQTTQPAQAPQPAMTAEQYHAEAQRLAVEADARYVTDFYDQILWNQAIRNAEAAVAAEPSNPTYLRTLAELYTRTQFWWRAYQNWLKLEQMAQLGDQERQWAALSAAKIGYIRLSRGLAVEAIPFLEASLRWEENPQVAAMLDVAQQQAADTAVQ